MKLYIGTKIVEAEPATLYDVKHERNGDLSSYNQEGYRVRYADGYESFSPKAVFERAYLPITINENLKTDQPSISQEMVDDFIREVHSETVGDKTTLVRVILRNGFEIVEASSCVSPENYDYELGVELCLKKVRDKVWMLLGFLLQTGVHGVNP